ncbi:MAG TPA: hypothetical protein VGM72_09725, partial [Micropepsaceae bacterium]
GMGTRQSAGRGWLVLVSALFCTLAYNLTFFVQELMLTLPKAFVPGVHVWLYHNNHHYEGNDPILPLLQGTGGVADLAVGLIFAAFLSGSGGRSMTARLFLFWMAFQGLYAGLSQIVIGALIPQNDMGMAYGYLGLTQTARMAMLAFGLIASVLAGFWLARKAILLLATTGETLNAGPRMGFLFFAVLLPVLIAGALIIPFRIPRDMIEVTIFPTIVMLFGAIWVLIGGALSSTAPRPAHPAPSLAVPLAALIVVLLIFQLVLRPGIAFS